MVGHYLPNKTKTCYSTFSPFFGELNTPLTSLNLPCGSEERRRRRLARVLQGQPSDGHRANLPLPPRPHLLLLRRQRLRCPPQHRAGGQALRFRKHLLCLKCVYRAVQIQSLVETEMETGPVLSIYGPGAKLQRWAL
jgi:hypothetical protein